jgi:hypothetical protein
MANEGLTFNPTGEHERGGPNKKQSNRQNGDNAYVDNDG